MGNIGMPELIVILVIAVLIFGAKRLPELGSSIGKAMRRFNQGIKGEESDKTDSENKKNPT